MTAYAAPQPTEDADGMVRMIAEAGFEWGILTRYRPAADPDALTCEARPYADGIMQKAREENLPMNLNCGAGCS